MEAAAQTLLEERWQMDIVKLKFSVYVCKGRPAWHVSGYLFYKGGGGVGAPCPFFHINDQFYLN